MNPKPIQLTTQLSVLTCLRGFLSSKYQIKETIVVAFHNFQILDTNGPQIPGPLVATAIRDLTLQQMIIII